MRAAQRGGMTRTALSIVFVSALAGLAACGSKSSKGNHGSESSGQQAVDSGQTAGSTATDNQDSSDNLGDTYEGVTCDDDNEGLAWCDDDYNIVYCDSGTWYTFDCAYIGDVCAQFDDGTVDCYDDFDDY
jgi:ABC-type oligopeptide transport system substrate-binding subunit